MPSDTPSTRTPDAVAPVRAPAHTRQVPVLGVPVSYESDSPEVLDVVVEALGAWRSMDRVPWLVEARGVHVCITIEDGEDRNAQSRGGPPDGIDHAGSSAAEPKDDAAPLAAEDATRRVVQVRISREMLEDPQQFRHGPVEAATFALLEPLDRARVNAAAVARDGTALLLVGPAGAGKSTLLYAASCAGLKVLADERVHVQTRPELRVWGVPGWLHLPAEAATHFAELTGISPVRLANGTSRLALEVTRLGALAEPPLARRVGVCLLRRDGAHAEPELEQVEPDRIMAGLRETVSGDDAYPEEMIPVVGRLGQRGAWVLNGSRPPQQLVRHLEQMLDIVAGQPAVAEQHP